MTVNFILPVYAAEHIALTMENEDNSTVTADINIEQQKAKLEKALDVSAHPKDVAHNIGFQSSITVARVSNNVYASRLLDST